MPSEFASLIGPSGCGKSTLLKLAANLIEPSDGRLQWWRGGFEAVGAPGRRLAFVFQDPTLMPWSRVEANVRLLLDLAGVPRREPRRRWRRWTCSRPRGATRGSFRAGSACACPSPAPWWRSRTCS